MTIKDLKQAIEGLPDDTVITFVSGANDNIISDFYDVETALYMEYRQRDGIKYLCFVPK